MKNAVVLNSRLYSSLFEIGNDELISVFSLLKFNKNSTIKYYNVKNYAELSKRTTLSITTLKKYVPILINLGLCKFESNGDFSVLGNNKINKLYKKGRLKLVPIEIGTYKQTKLFSFRVRILRMEQNQKNTIDTKSNRNNIIAKGNKRQFLSKLEFKQLKNLKKKDISITDINDKVILSIQGYYKLKSGKQNKGNNGQFWKAKLIEAGIIKARRVQELIKKCNKEEFKALRGYDKSLFYYKGGVYRELISEFTTTEFNNTAPKVINREVLSKPLQHLDFDFCHWLSIV